MEIVAKVNGKSFSEAVLRLRHAVDPELFDGQVVLRMNRASGCVMCCMTLSFEAAVRSNGIIKRDFEGVLSFEDLVLASRFIREHGSSAMVPIFADEDCLTFVITEEGAILSIPCSTDHRAQALKMPARNREAQPEQQQLCRTLEMLRDWQGVFGDILQGDSNASLQLLMGDKDPIITVSAPATLAIYHPNRSPDEAISMAAEAGDAPTTLSLPMRTVYSFLRDAQPYLRGRQPLCFLTPEGDRNFYLCGNGFWVYARFTSNLAHHKFQLRDIPPLVTLPSFSVKRYRLGEALALARGGGDGYEKTEVTIKRSLMHLRTQCGRRTIQSHVILDGDDTVVAKLRLYSRFLDPFIQWKARDSYLDLYVCKRLLIIHDKSASFTVIAKDRE